MADTSNFLEIWRDGMISSSRQVLKLQRSFDQFVTQLFSPQTLWGIAHGEDIYAPPCDIKETKQEFIVKFDIPGVSKNDLKVEIVNQQLTVSGERRLEEEHRHAGSVTKEIFQGAFSRSISIPGDVDLLNVQAQYQDGILQIHLPKVQVEERRREIEVQEGERHGPHRVQHQAHHPTQHHGKHAA